MNFVLFLCKDYNNHTHKFCQFLNKNFAFKSLMIIDNNETNYSQRYLKEVYQISDEVCVESGFKNCVSGSAQSHIKKTPNSWDKALYFLSINNFNKAILIEDDCLVLNPKIFSNWFDKQFDLLAPAHNKRSGTYQDWHWKSIESNIDPPHFYSMVCCIGVSKQLIDKIIEHKNKVGSFFFTEAMFNTIAEQNRLIVKTPKELSSVVAMGDWELWHFRLFKNNIFHPVKNIEEHNYYRFLNLVTLKYCMEVKHLIISPKPYEQLLIPKFLKR